MAADLVPRRQARALADELTRRRHELRITSKAAAAKFCGVSEATYAGAEDPDGQTRTQDESLRKIAKRFELDFFRLRDLRDGRQPEALAVTVEDLTIAGMVDHLRELPAPGVRQAVISLVHEIYDALRVTG